MKILYVIVLTTNYDNCLPCSTLNALIYLGQLHSSTSTYIYQTFYFQSVRFLSSYSTKSAESILFVGKSVPVKIYLLQDVFARLGSSPRNTDQLLVLSAVNHVVEMDSLSLGNNFHRLGSSVKLKGYWRWSAERLVVLSDYFT